MKLCDMSPEQALAWAEGEHTARLADLQDRSADGLRIAQDNAERRRKAVGASRTQVAALVSEVARLRRRAEFNKATGVTQ